MDCNLPGSSVHGDSPGVNTGVGCHSLLQGIYPTQGSNPGLPHCRQILYHLSHRRSPNIPFIWAFIYIKFFWEFLVVQWLRFHVFNPRGEGSVPDQGTKIPHAEQCSQKKKSYETDKLISCCSHKIVGYKIWGNDLLTYISENSGKKRRKWDNDFFFLKETKQWKTLYFLPKDKTHWLRKCFSGWDTFVPQFLHL